MAKFFLLLVLAAGAFFLLSVLLPHQAWTTAFTAWGHVVPWIAIGILAVVYIGYKKVSG